MEAELIRTFRFEAAHRLPNIPHEHKCRRMHGHNYRVDVHVTGPVDPHVGWVMDFDEIRRIVHPVLEALDHQVLNEVPGLANCTSELLARYMWDRVAPSLAGLTAITIWESDNSRCVYRGK